MNNNKLKATAIFYRLVFLLTLRVLISVPNRKVIILHSHWIQEMSALRTAVQN